MSWRRGVQGPLQDGVGPEPLILVLLFVVFLLIGIVDGCLSSKTEKKAEMAPQVTMPTEIKK